MDNLTIAGRLRAEVCARHGVGPRSIHSRCRLAYLVAARHELIWLIRQSTTWSTPEIGRYMGMDHSSIVHAIQRHEQWRRQRRAQTMGDSETCHSGSNRDRRDFTFRGSGRIGSRILAKSLVVRDPRSNIGEEPRAPTIRGRSQRQIGPGRHLPRTNNLIPWGSAP